MKNIILIVSLLLMGVSSRADILNSSDNKNVADKFDPMLKAALFQMKIMIPALFYYRILITWRIWS